MCVSQAVPGHWHTDRCKHAAIQGSAGLQVQVQPDTWRHLAGSYLDSDCFLWDVEQHLAPLGKQVTFFPQG